MSFPPGAAHASRSQPLPASPATSTTHWAPASCTQNHPSSHPGSASGAAPDSITIASGFAGCTAASIPAPRSRSRTAAESVRRRFTLRWSGGGTLFPASSASVASIPCRAIQRSTIHSGWEWRIASRAAGATCPGGSGRAARSRFRSTAFTRPAAQREIFAGVSPRTSFTLSSTAAHAGTPPMNRSW